MQDLNGVKQAEIVVSDKGNLWVNVDGQCVLRIQDIERLAIEMPEKQPKNTMTIVVSGATDGEIKKAKGAL